MPIKKSLLLVLALTVCSVALLVSSFSKTPAPAACPAGKCCQQKSTMNQSASPRDLMTQGMFHLST